VTDLAHAPRLSKSRFIAGLQCHQLLWWRVHEPDAPELEPDPGRRAIFDQGNRVGERARATVPGGVLIDVPHTEPFERVRRTAEAMRDGAPAIYEAAFIADDVFVAVDILERGAAGWRLIEVKASTRIKNAYLDDIAVQLHVLRRAGIAVSGAELMLLDRECVYPDLTRLFVRHDVTAALDERLARAPERIAALQAMLDGESPAIAIGPQCRTPYVCPFVSRCWRDVPPHHVTTLYATGRRAWAFVEEGLATIDRLPDGLEIPMLAERQRVAVRDGRRFVGPDLGPALAALARPRAVLDFETLGPAIPVWTGCRPFDAVPAQFSVRIEDGGGGWRPVAWLASGPEDPRPELVRRVVEALDGAGSVLAYNASFERIALERIAAALPALAPAIERVLVRLVDALPLVRDHVYDPAFHGSFSLKSVLPAMVPGLSYEALAIGEGLSASHELERLLFDEATLAPADRDRLRDDLTRYCDFDTLAVVRLLDALESIAAGR
jgi:hypothetical protein